jgi:hypothetical protein
MVKVRLAALVIATASVGLMTTPASAAKAPKSVFKTRGKDATALVTDCPAQPAAGTKCVAWIVYASQSRIKQDGSVTTTGGLSLEKYRLKFFDGGGFVPTLTAAGYTDSPTIQIANDLSTATASATVDLVKCDATGTSCTTKSTSVSFSLAAVAAPDRQDGKVVTTFGPCHVVERFNSRNRTAEGSAVINGATLATSDTFPSSIGSSAYTSVARNCAPVGP